MKPGPFKDVDYVDSLSKIRLKSNQVQHNEGLTQVLDPKSKILYTLPIFVGRHKLDLSPDGKLLILSGNFYFTTLIQPSKNEELATIFEQGKIIKKISLGDLIKEDPAKLTENLKLSVMGGGWVELSDFIKKMDINWKERSITFHLYNNEARNITF